MAADKTTEFYTPSSNLTISGNTSGTAISYFGIYGGTYYGSGNIKLFYAASIALLQASPTLTTIDNVTVKNAGADNFNATFRLVLNGTDFGDGNPVRATIDVLQQWTNQGGNGGWHIRDEYWDMLTHSQDFNISY